jgi:hypothetical protein
MRIKYCVEYLFYFYLILMLRDVTPVCNDVLSWNCFSRRFICNETDSNPLSSKLYYDILSTALHFVDVYLNAYKIYLFNFDLIL